MITVQEALKLPLSRELLDELAKHPPTFIVCISQGETETLTVVPDTADNLSALASTPTAWHP